MSTHINTIIVVQLHVKVNIDGDFDSASELKHAAVLKAMNTVEDSVLGIEEVESGKALVNDEVVEGWFSAK